jgi:hypothetical protein
MYVGREENDSILEAGVFWQAGGRGQVAVRGRKVTGESVGGGGAGVATNM